MTEQQDRIETIRMRARDAGLSLDDERLAALAEAWPGVEAMTTTIERVEIDPLDLALEPFDPAWGDLERRR